MDETRARDTRGHCLRTFAYTPNPLGGGFWGREFDFSQSHKKQKGQPKLSFCCCGMDETRTRDPLRDRQVF